MLGLDEIKNSVEMESVTIGDQTFKCVKDTDSLIKILDEALNRGIDPDDKKTAVDFFLYYLGNLYFKFSLLKEYSLSNMVIASLAPLVELHGKEFKNNKNYSNFLVGALACMENDPESFRITKEKLLPDSITSSSLAFNLACMHNVHGMEQEALKYAELALDLGYRKEEFLNDPQLKSLHDNPLFDIILSRRMFLSGEKPPAEKIITLIKHLADEGVAEIETGDDLAYRVAEYLNDKSITLDDRVNLLKAWLEAADRINVSAHRKQYVAQFASGIITGHPELVNELENRLLRDEMTDEWYFFNIADVLASMNLPEKAFTYVDLAMRGKIGKDSLEYRKNLKELYKIDYNFRSMVDAHDMRKKELKEYLLKEPDPDSFGEVFTAAQVEFTSCYSYQRSGRITAVAKFRDDQHRSKIDEFLKTGFDSLRNRLRKKDELINDVMFNALAAAIAEWQDGSFTGILLKEFMYVTDEEMSDGISRHYELNQTAGTIAVALTALGYGGDTSVFDPFLESYEWRYKGEPFIMKVRYAKWFIEKNSEQALAFLEDEVNSKGLGYALCAIADLNAKESLPAIENIQKGITNPVTAEIVKETIIRLKSQTAEPAWEDRMIRLFGTVSDTEMALGADNDNQFVLRARQAKQDNRIGVVFEADDPAEDDR